MNKWIAHYNNIENSDYNLFCFPYTGGSASYFAPWINDMPENVGIAPVLYPMRETRFTEPLMNTVEEMAAALVEDSIDLFRKPFAFYGHCSGAVIAYETAVVLKKKYDIAPLLFTAASAQSPRNTPTNPDVMKMSDSELAEYAVKLGMLDRELVSNQEFMAYYFHIFKADFLMIFNYNTNKTERIDCPILAITGKDDAFLNRKSIEDWSSYTDELEVMETDGEHFFGDAGRAAVIKAMIKKIGK